MNKENTKSREEFPLSFAQQQLWFQLQHSASPLIFNYSSIINFPSDLNLAAIENGVNFLFQRHDALRLRIHERNGQPFQTVQDYGDANTKVIIPISDLSLAPKTVIESALKANLMIPFQLDKGPLCKFYIIKSPEATLLQGVAHHLILDGVGTQILEEEGKIIIQEFAKGSTHQEILTLFPPLEYTYTDFVFWQQTNLAKDAGTDWVKSSTFWKKYLDGIIPLNLGKDGNSRSPCIGLDAERLEFNWPDELGQSIQLYSKAHGVSPFVILTSGLAIVLGRLSSGQTDIGILIGKHGRSSRKLSNIVGHFSNVLPFRINLNLGGNFLALVKQVKQDMKYISAHQDYSIQLIFKDLEGLSGSGQRIDQHLFFPVTIVNTPKASKLGSASTNYLEIDNLKLTQEIIIHLQGNEMAGYVKYNPLIHSRQRIQGMLNTWITILANAFKSEGSKNLSEIEIINMAELEELKKIGTGKKVQVGDMDLTLVEHFEKQAAKTPEGIAIFEENGEQMTYSTLLSKSRALARTLTNGAHIKNEDKFVAVLMEQSSLFIQTTLAILMSGKTIAVLSVHSSTTELKQMLTDIGTPLLVSTMDVLQRCDFMSYSPRLALGLDQAITCAGAGVCADSKELQLRNANPDAYCIFTSGTTGGRKGTLLRHSCIIHFCNWSIEEKKYTRKDRTLGFNDVSSDSSLSDIWSTLLSGATLCIPPNSFKYDIQQLWHWIVAHDVTIVQFQTALTNKMLANAKVMALAKLSKVRMLTCGGDRLNSSASVSLPFILYNEYGLTETTVPVTSTLMSMSNCQDKDNQSQEILQSVGRPIWNTNVWILDPQLNIVPIGVHGKIHVSGPGIGKYWKNDELNQIKFKKLRKTYCADTDADAQVVFDTGDVGYWDWKGNLNIVGRMDTQVKFKSYRIELKEIEGVLSSYPSIQAAVVQIVADKEKNQTETQKFEELIAYCKLDGSKIPTFEDLLKFLKNRLPYYSVPSKIYTLTPFSDFPLNPNGKIDFEKLNQQRKSKTLNLLTPNFVAPRTEEERKIAKIWAEVLQLPYEKISLHDHFFSLGGHSFLVMKFVRRLQTQFPSIKIHAEAIFREPTVHGLAKLIKSFSKLTLTCPNNSSLQEIMENSKGEEELIDFEEEIHSAVADISFSAKDLPISTSTQIFLTGATGFLGSCLLVELLKRRKNSQIYCLVRGQNAEVAEARLKQAIRPFNLTPEDLQRISVLLGDMSIQKFGLEDSVYDDLATNVGIVYHTADFVHLLQPYRFLSELNVEGIKQILRFSTTSTLKTLHYVSSIEVYYDLPSYYDKFGPIVYETPITELKINPAEYPTGYSQCKWVAEHLVCSAMARGLPAIIYRPGEITAHSKFNLIHPADVLYMSLKYCIGIGHIPDVLGVRIPSGSLDFNCKAIVEISMKKECVGKTFHVFSHDILIQDVFDLISASPSLVPRAISIVSIDEWEKKFCEYIASFPESTQERKNMERYLCFWFHFKRHFSQRFYHKLKVSNQNTKLALGDLDALSESTLTEDILHALSMAL